MAKIEIDCRSCGSILRVDREHAGKQARCPHCGGLSIIPGDSQEAERNDDSDGDRKAVPAPDVTQLPFQEEFYQTAESGDGAGGNRSPDHDSTSAWEANTGPRTETQAEKAHVGKASDEFRKTGIWTGPVRVSPHTPQTSYPRDETAPLRPGVRVGAADGRRGIGPGLVGLAILVLAILSLPVCFCFTPLLLAPTVALSKRTTEGLQALCLLGAAIVTVVWLIRIVVFLGF